MISPPPSYAPRQFADDRKTPSRSRESSRRHGGESKDGSHPALFTPRLSLPPASSTSCSLQRFNAILCKFVCGQVYMVPGLSVSFIHPPPLLDLSTSSASSRRRLPPRFKSTAIVSPLSALLHHFSGSTSPKAYQHTRGRIHAHMSLYHSIYTWMCTRGVQKAAYLLLFEPAIIT